LAVSVLLTIQAVITRRLRMARIKVILTIKGNVNRSLQGA